MKWLSFWKSIISIRFEKGIWEDKHEDNSLLELLVASEFSMLDLRTFNVPLPEAESRVTVSGLPKHFIKPVNSRAISSLLVQDYYSIDSPGFSVHGPRGSSKKKFMAVESFLTNDKKVSAGGASNVKAVADIKAVQNKPADKSVCPVGFPAGFVAETVATTCNGCGLLTVSRDFGCMYNNVDLLYGGENGKKLAIVSMYDNIDPQLVELTLPNKKKYAEKYKHVFYDLSISKLDPQAAKEGPLYAKLYAVKSVLDKHSWIMWSDADSLFTNPNRRLIDLLDDRYHVIITATLFPNHPGYKIPNTGSFFVRNSPEGKKFLEKWIEVGRGPHMEKGWGDQGSLMELIRKVQPNSESDNIVKFIEHRTCNGEVPWNLDSDLIAHTPGAGLAHKLQKLSKYRNVQF